jgi:hypothetical protein
MTYYEAWMEGSENSENQAEYTIYVQKYYDKEKQAYDIILSAYPDNGSFTSGVALNLSEKLGYERDEMDLFVGFLDGINPSISKENDVKALTDDSLVELGIDYEKLYWNMREAKADWLYNLPSWKNVFPKEKLDQITRDFRKSKEAHSEKIGRNDPCPCGSGKKYKQCCINK